MNAERLPLLVLGDEATDGLCGPDGCLLPTDHLALGDSSRVDPLPRDHAEDSTTKESTP